MVSTCLSFKWNGSLYIYPHSTDWLSSGTLIKSFFYGYEWYFQVPLWKSATTTGATLKECHNENARIIYIFI